MRNYLSNLRPRLEAVGDNKIIFLGNTNDLANTKKSFDKILECIKANYAKDSIRDDLKDKRDRAKLLWGRLPLH